VYTTGTFGILRSCDFSCLPSPKNYFGALKIANPRSWVSRGGLTRSAGEWFTVRSQRSRGAQGLSDERILGSGEFAERILREADTRALPQHAARKRNRYAERVVAEECKKSGVSLTELRSGSRRGHLPAVRTKISSWARGKLRSGGRRDRSPDGNLDFRGGFEDPNGNFVHLINTVTQTPHKGVLSEAAAVRQRRNSSRHNGRR